MLGTVLTGRRPATDPAERVVQLAERSLRCRGIAVRATTGWMLAEDEGVTDLLGLASATLEDLEFAVRESVRAFDWSVIIPCFNPGPFVVAAATSAVAAGCAPRNLVLVDDGGNDGWPERVHEVVHGSRLLRHSSPAGPARARNVGLSLVSTSWVSFLDQDDLFIPAAIRQLLADHTRSGRSHLPIAGGVLNLRGNALRARMSWPSREFDWPTAGLDLLLENVQIGRWVFNMESIRGIRFSDQVGYADDNLFVVQACNVTGGALAAPNPILAYRVHPEQTSKSQTMDRSITEEEYLLRRYEDSCLAVWPTRRVRRRLRAARWFHLARTLLQEGAVGPAQYALMRTLVADRTILIGVFSRRVIAVTIRGALGRLLRNLTVSLRSRYR